MNSQSSLLNAFVARLAHAQARAAGQRWSFALFSLLALLQRTPVLRLFFAGGDGLPLSPAAQVLRCGIGAVTAMGAIQTLAGATTYTQNPSGTINATVGDAVQVTFTITGAPKPVASFTVSGTLPPGLSIAGLSNGIVNNATPVISGTVTTAGSYSVDVQGYDGLNATGDTDKVKHKISFAIAAAAVTVTPPTISTQPVSVSVASGQPVALLSGATSTAAVTYQWYKDGVAVAGATSPTLYIASAGASTAGSYTFVATNAGGSVTSSPAVVSLSAASASQMIVMSVQAIAQPNAPVTPGITIAGSNAVTVLIRAAGPALAVFNLTDHMNDPQLTLYNVTSGTPVKVAYNNDWDSSLSTVFNKEGAFAYTSGSKDAALLVTLPPGLYTVEVSDTANVAGRALIEVYSVQ